MTAAAQMLAVLRALPARVTAIVLGVVAVAVWVGALISGSGWTLSFDADLGIPILFTGGLAFVAGCLLWVVAESPSAPASERRAWRALAVALALIGVEQALSLHERIDEGLGLAAAVGALPLLALTVLALLLALRVPAIPERALLVGALCIWAAAGVLDALDHGGGAVAALLFLAAAPILAVAALGAVQRCRFDPASPPPPFEIALRDLLLLVDATKLTIGVLVALGAMLGLAALYHAGVVPAQTFDLRSQQGANTFCSIALLITAGCLALLRGRLSGDPWFAWTLLGIVFLAMAVNDTIAGHHLIGEETGVPGQLVLFPIVVAAGVAWLTCVRLSSAPIQRLLFAGAITWVGSQLIDLTQPEGYFHWWVLPEEALELVGTTLFATGLLLAVQAMAAGSGRGPARRRGEVAERDLAAVPAGGA